MGDVVESGVEGGGVGGAVVVVFALDVAADHLEFRGVEVDALGCDPAVRHDLRVGFECCEAVGLRRRWGSGLRCARRDDGGE